MNDEQYQQMLQAINERFKSKNDLYKYMKNNQHIYLPKEDYCTLHFLQQMLDSQKIATYKRDAPIDCKIPSWPELSVRKIWPMAIRFPDFLQRVPDEWNGGIRTDRAFVWTILMLVNEDFVTHMVEDCRKQRKQRTEFKARPPTFMNIRPEVAEMLLRSTFVSTEKKRGPSLFVSRQVRQHQRRAQPTAPIVPNVNVEDFIGQQANNVNQNDGEGASQQEDADLVEQLNNQNQQIQQKSGIARSQASSIHGGSVANQSFHSAAGDQVEGRMASFNPSNQTMVRDSLGRGNLIDEGALFQMAEDGNDGNQSQNQNN